MLIDLKSVSLVNNILSYIVWIGMWRSYLIQIPQKNEDLLRIKLDRSPYNIFLSLNHLILWNPKNRQLQPCSYPFSFGIWYETLGSNCKLSCVWIPSSVWFLDLLIPPIYHKHSRLSFSLFIFLILLIIQ